MTAALRAPPADRVLEIGTGSGYAAAILGSIAREVYTIERHGPLADTATRAAARARIRQRARPSRRRHARLARARALRRHHRDRRRTERPGGPAGAARVGGRLVIPVGEEKALQTLVRVTRERRRRLRARGAGRRALRAARRRRRAGRRGVDGPAARGAAARPPPSRSSCARWRSRSPTSRLPTSASLLERIGDARVVLIGEATHGTSEFYALRAHITRGAHPLARLHDRRGRGRLARRGPRRPLRPGPAPLPGPDVAGLRPFPDLDVAQSRGARVRRVAAGVERGARRPGGVGFYGLDLYSMYRRSGSCSTISIGSTRRRPQSRASATPA